MGFTARGRFGALAALGVVASLALAACGSGGSSDTASDTSTGGSTELSGKITVWAWEPTLKDVVTQFEKDNPKVTVDLVNAGTGNDQYTALQNAISAGSGVPDVAQVEYYALPQFALSKSLTDLTKYGADSLESKYSTGPWNSVVSGDAVYGLPMDAGPMALFYNKTVFDQYGLTVPTTWDEYVADAQKLHAANPNAYMTNDTGDAGFTTSMIWQAGGHPYKVDGTNVTIDFSDKGSTQFADMWNTMIKDQLVAPISSWSDEWYTGLGNGTIASLVIGAWMPANLESGVAGGSGQWRVAAMPQWNAGDKASAENGGSSLTVPAASKNAELAYEFVKYANEGPGVDIRVKAGNFPSTTDTLKSSEFLDATSDYFGGQKINEVLADSAANVLPDWQYLPFQVYANSIFNDNVGPAYTGSTTLADGLKAWQDASISYGEQQGFTVK